jgi:hypothetical protein
MTLHCSGFMLLGVGRPQLITVLAASVLSTPSLWLMWLSSVLNVAWFYIYKQGNMSAMCSSVLLRYVTLRQMFVCTANSRGPDPFKGFCSSPGTILNVLRTRTSSVFHLKKVTCLEDILHFPSMWAFWSALNGFRHIPVCVCVYMCACARAHARVNLCMIFLK